MDINDLPGNSRAAKNAGAEPEPEKKLDKVVTGEVSRRKPGLGKRFKEVFTPGDMSSVGQYVVFDILIPAFKDMVLDAGKETLERMINGERKPGERRRTVGGFGGNGHVDYNRMSKSAPWRREERREERPTLSRRARQNHDFDEILLATRREGELVIDRMYDAIERYEQVTVGDLYDLLGISSDFTDQKYGWTDLTGAQVRRARDGYLLDLPKPEPL